MPSKGFEWSYRDLLTALLVVFIAMAVLALVATTSKNDRRPIQGNLIFEMHWSPQSNSDIDLWVKSPGDKPVGFMHPSGINCNLLRDDLGRLHDPSSENEEMVVCRNAPPGEYIVNVMAYNVYDQKFPIDVSLEGTYSSSAVTNRLFTKSVKLSYKGEERTVIRFRLSKMGFVEDGSVNEAPIMLFRAN